MPPPAPSPLQSAAWKILPIAGGQFRWIPIDSPVSPSEKPFPSETLPASLPSIANLLQQAPPKVLEAWKSTPANEEGSEDCGVGCGSGLKLPQSTNACFDDDVPMFSTGLGRSVSVNKSSLQNAATVFEGVDGVERISYSEDGFQMFHTASGRSITVKQSSKTKAATFLELDGAQRRDAKVSIESVNDEVTPMFSTASGKSIAVKQSSIRKAAVLLEAGDAHIGDANQNMGNNDSVADGGYIPMFRTASGKSVAVNQSLIRKAAEFLDRGHVQSGDAVFTNAHTVDSGMFNTASGKSVAVKESSIRKAATFLEGADIQSADNVVRDYRGLPMFSSGSGNSVTLKQSSIAKATFLEGVDSQGDEALSSKHGLPLLSTRSGNSVTVKQSSIRKAAAFLQGADVQDGNVMVKDECAGETELPIFSTGSGKTVSVKESSIRRAASLLEGEDLQREEVLEVAVDKKSSFSKSVFQTGFGKTLDISSSGLSKVSSLLGLEQNNALPSASLHENALVQINADLCTPLNQSHSKMVLQKPFTFESNITGSFYSPVLQTAGRKFISVSSSALLHAKNLLGDMELEAQPNSFVEDTSSSFLVDKVDKTSDENLWCKENIYSNSGKGRDAKDIMSHAQTSRSAQSNSSVGVAKFQDTRRSDKLSVPGSFSMPDVDVGRVQVLSSGKHVQISTKDPHSITSRRPLVDISNNADRFRANSISPYKKPRTSRFTSPLDSRVAPPTSVFKSESRDCCSRKSVSSHYPAQHERKTVEEFFSSLPKSDKLLGSLPDDVKYMSPDKAEKYRFPVAAGVNSLGPDELQMMLLQSGASVSNATKGWVANHYKWIVWKLACYERCYPSQVRGMYLTVLNVLNELKYRYEREFNHGHRSAIKKMLDSDASPSSMMILCVSSVHVPDLKEGKGDDMVVLGEGSKESSNSNNAGKDRSSKLELTDGWYSLDANLDILLSNKLAAGKIFVGQKLRIWGADLCGWSGPVSSIEALKTVRLVIHMNGTYRAHWQSPLGFCKSVGPPLAFRCIKGAGGRVPRTLVGILRIYPILYKERFHDGGSIIRSERMEMRAVQLYNQTFRRCNVAEDIMCRSDGVLASKEDATEGANIFKMLQNAAEPEVLMADMSSEQLTSFRKYQAKQEANRLCDMKTKIEAALEEAGVSSRDVTSFMKVRVVGLTKKDSSWKGQPREGLITIWNPTEKQKVDLVEGHAYSVSGLMPLNHCFDPIHLQGRGSSMLWRPISALAVQKFKPFLSPRRPTKLSNLGEIPLASEFDTAAVVVHVGEVYLSACLKKQWMFITDGSNCSSALKEPFSCILAVCFSEPLMGDDRCPILSHALSGTAVALSNLVKRARDEVNHLLVAEATETSSYCVAHCLPKSSHLKEAAVAAEKWAKASASTIQKLKERVLCITGEHGSSCM